MAEMSLGNEPPPLTPLQSCHISPLLGRGPLSAGGRVSSGIALNQGKFHPQEKLGLDNSEHTLGALWGALRSSQTSLLHPRSLSSPKGSRQAQCLPSLCHSFLGFSTRRGPSQPQCPPLLFHCFGDSSVWFLVVSGNKGLEPAWAHPGQCPPCLSQGSS